MAADERDSEPRPERFITTKEAASLLGVDEMTLKRRRFKNYKGPPGPPYYERLGGGRIFYKEHEVLAFRPVLKQRAKEEQPLPRVPLPPSD